LNRLFSGPSSSSPRPDGGRVLFEIIEDGEEISCAISREALEDIGEMPCYRPADLLRSFSKARVRIERLAFNKLRARPGISGRLNLWAGDVDEKPPGGAAVNESLSTQPG